MFEWVANPMGEGEKGVPCDWAVLLVGALKPCTVHAERAVIGREYDGELEFWDGEQLVWCFNFEHVLWWRVAREGDL